MIQIEMEVIANLPPYYEIAEALWGKGADIDSDGNSSSPESVEWTELTLILRKDPTQRIDIDPKNGSSQLILKSESKDLAMSVLSFLRNYGAVK